MKRRVGYILLLAVATSACVLLYSYTLNKLQAEKGKIQVRHLTETSQTGDIFGVRNILYEKNDKVFVNSIRKMIEKLNTSLPQEPILPSKRMNALVIVAGYRTGSSFIGQMFNQHPDVFYLFEPLFFSKRKLIPELNAKVLEDLVLCNMSTIHRETLRVWDNQLSNKENVSAKKGQNIRKCIDYGICFREKSRALCTPDMCGGKDLKYCRYCPRARLQDIEKKCQEAKLRVIKVIRVTDISQLKRSWKNKNIDLKIVHLVRDPRATTLSRYKLDRTTEMKTLIGRTCNENAANHGHVINKDDNYRWLEGIYKLIRYEDAIEGPQTFAKELYNFINVPDLRLHPDVVSWIRNSTKSYAGNAYSTRRNIQKQKNIWRRKITFSGTLKVQSICDAMMKILGYKTVQSEEELRNLNITLIGKPKTVT